MLFRLFTLHPDIFGGFISNSLIARGISNKIIDLQTVNWRQDFGIGKYGQVDDKPFGGGSGMVLMAEPIINAMHSVETDNTRSQEKGIEENTVHQSYLPNNSKFWESIHNDSNKTKKVNVMMTPRGFPLTQATAQWLSESFDEINILCGRYEGFDARVNDFVDLEISVGNFILNGGEVGAMCLVESVSRLVPDFITKNTSVLHDSFSSGLNDYDEFDFGNSKQPISKQKKLAIEQNKQKQIDQKNTNLFDDNWWIANILPHIEHPQYTRPETWNKQQIPKVLLSGNHKNIQQWRKKWW